MILDFFAGSATTGQACYEIENENKGSRSFILIQYPELIEQTPVTQKLNLYSIYDIGRDRLKARINELDSIKYGFKANAEKL